MGLNQHRREGCLALQVDLLITERKEAQQAAQSDESTKRQKEADNNAYLSLMPLALPAPPMGGANDFSGELVRRIHHLHYDILDNFSHLGIDRDGDRRSW